MRTGIYFMLGLGFLACSSQRSATPAVSGIAGGTGGVAAGEGGVGGGGAGCALPASYRWSSTGPIIAPVSDANHDLTAIKDPTVVFFQDRWHVYASSVTSSGAYGLVYTSFTDFSQASSGTFYTMDRTPGFATYAAAPELFYFAPQARWYLVFQSGPPMYSTNDDPGNPAAWTPPAPLFAKEPAIITQNGGWLDFWVICDDATCSLFFSDNHGRWYRSSTAIGDFPGGFGEPNVVMEDSEAGRLFEASNVYKVRGTNRYLALVEAWDSTSNWRRYFRSWTADSLDGPWVPLKDSGTAPFAGTSNVSFAGPAWTKDISHGEAIRAGYDQTLTIDPCDLRFLYQGFDSTVDTSDYNAIPWRLGLLTRDTTSGGDAGTGGTGAVDCNPPQTVKCTGTRPPGPLIADFSAPDGGAAAVFGGWGESIFGGIYAYPGIPSSTDACAGPASQYPLTSTTSEGAWRITGQVGTYSGAGLWWNCNTGTTATPAYTGSCTIDGSGYTGISFTVWGDAGPAVGDAGSGGITVSVSDPGTTQPTTDSAGGPSNCGTCTSNCGTSVQVPVSSTPRTVSLTWADLGVTNPAAITGISLALSLPPNMDWSTGISSSPYPLDLSLDGLRFTN